MADLSPVGVPGPEELRNLLTTCADPLTAIEEFQSKNSVQLASLTPALKLLDLHGVRRLEFHEAVMNDLRERLLSKVKELGQQSVGQQFTNQQQKEATKRLEELVGKSFKLIHASRLRPVALEALNCLPKVPKKYLQEIRDNESLYKDVAINVRQQIWEQTPSKFLDELRPLVARYCEEKRTQLRSLDSLTPIFYSESGKARRQTELIQTLVQMVGRHLKLYDQLLQYIRERFYETQDTHLCSLRSELLMALHDADVQELTSVDPCHKFAWCLDACVRERHLDSKHASEMKGVLDGVRHRNREQILGDLAMIAGEPHAIHFFAQLILKVLHQCSSSETLPRDHAALQLVLRLLNLGLWAWKLLKNSDFKEPKVESIVYTKFLPALMTLMAEDSCRIQMEKLPDDGTVAEDLKSNIVDRCSKPPNETLTVFVKSELLGACLFMYYALELGRKRDRFGLCRLAPTLRRTNSDLANSEEFVSAFVHALAPMLAENANDDLLWEAVMERYLMLKAGGEGDQSITIKAQVLRLIFFMASKFVSTGKHEALMERLALENWPTIEQEQQNEQKEDDTSENAWYQILYSKVWKRLSDVQNAAVSAGGSAELQPLQQRRSSGGGPPPSVLQQQMSYDYAMPPATPSISAFGFDLADVPTPM